jgi:uncharacterized protein (TIGR00251 family)
VVKLTVRVMPRASKTGIAGTRDGALLVKLQSPPVEGAANEELIEVVAATFGVAKRDVMIVSGERSKLKRIAIDTIERDHVKRVLSKLGINAESLSS